VLSSGQFIRLFHKEYEGFASVIPNDLNRRNMKNPLESLLEFMIDPFSEKVAGIRTTKSFQDRRDIDSLHTVWQIEHQDIENGDPIEARTPIRLRNILYNVYLKVMYTDRYLEDNGLKYNSEGKLVERKNRG
jgi:hypothetical protein